VPERVDIFDKQHGTFKQFVSENTAGFDLVLHCRKPLESEKVETADVSFGFVESIQDFLKSRSGKIPMTVYLHVSRESERDLRMLYSEWIAFGLVRGHGLTDFASFREVAGAVLDSIASSGETKDGPKLQCDS
jgi:hypothetical protein